VDAKELLFADTHEWVHIASQAGGKIATVGISAHAVEALTDLVYMELPPVGKKVSSGQPFGEVESVKATSDLYSPVDGEIVEVNSSLPDNLDVLSNDPYGKGWIIKVKLSNESSLANLMDYPTYEKQCSETH
jgi:glycine cleavage system H protein